MLKIFLKRIRDDWPFEKYIFITANFSSFSNNDIKHTRICLKVSTTLSTCATIQKSFDRSNLTYLISEIKKPGFEELDFVISPCIVALTILKTMIFVYNIDTVGQLKLYLQSRLFPRFQTKAKLFIQIFLANLTVDTRSHFLEGFHK